MKFELLLLIEADCVDIGSELEAVSYTHLDVYKRQTLWYAYIVANSWLLRIIKYYNPLFKVKKKALTRDMKRPC